MRILSRYFFKEFFKFFIICLAGMTAILLVAEFFDKVDEFYAKETPVYLILQYLLLQAPRLSLFASPIASLLAILFTIGMASKWKETIAIKASGGSLKKLFSSFLLLGIIISILVLIFSETMAPMATRKASWLRYTKILKKPSRITYREGVLWVKGLDGSLIRIRDFIEDEDRILKVSIFSFSPSFKLIKRIEADEAEWIDGRWRLKNAAIFDFEQGDTINHNFLTFTALEEPKIFREEIKAHAEMTSLELYAYSKRLERAGFNNNKYLVDFYVKLSYPLVNFIMIIFGIALALNRRWGGGIRAAGLGIIVIVFYWMIFSLNISLGNTGILPPALAALLTPALFCLAGGYMYLRINE